MNGVHDMGGMHGFGNIEPQNNGQSFHHDWERRIFAVTLASGALGRWNLDVMRAARESLPAPQYLSSSYFQIWFAATVSMLVSRGLVTAVEVASGKACEVAEQGLRILSEAAVDGVLASGGPSLRPSSAKASFQVGEQVRTRLINPTTHTRLPRYCRGKIGTVIAAHSTHVFPDSNAIGQGENPQWLYTVEFDAIELWGPDTTASSVCVDCWESYLAPSERS
jgi:nitrile hydratase